MKKLIPLIVLFMLSTFSVLAQDSNRYVCITMHTGIQRCGYLINDDGKEITIETKALGKVILLKENVVSIFDASEGTIGSSSADADFIEDQEILLELFNLLDTFLPLLHIHLNKMKDMVN